MHIFLETERLVLRAFTEADVERLVELDGDADVMRFISGGRPTSREVIRARTLPRFLHVHPCTGTRGYWAALEKTTRAFLGWFEFRPLVLGVILRAHERGVRVSLGEHERSCGGAGLGCFVCDAVVHTNAVGRRWVLVVGADVLAVERVMRRGGLECPGCGDALAPWGVRSAALGARGDRCTAGVEAASYEVLGVPGHPRTAA